MRDPIWVAIIGAIGLVISAIVTGILAPRMVKHEKGDVAETAVELTLDEEIRKDLTSERILMLKERIDWQEEQMEAKDQIISYLTDRLDRCERDRDKGKDKASK